MPYVDAIIKPYDVIYILGQTSVLTILSALFTAREMLQDIIITTMSLNSQTLSHNDAICCQGTRTTLLQVMDSYLFNSKPLPGTISMSIRPLETKISEIWFKPQRHFDHKIGYENECSGLNVTGIEYPSLIGNNWAIIKNDVTGLAVR